MASSGGSDPAALQRHPGRPRLYEPGAERRRILTAALDVLRRNQGEEATVAEILESAGLSTRAFYRHFKSKEEVIRALYRRDAESVAAHLRRRSGTAEHPEEALASWVTEMLGLAYDRRRAERMAALSSNMVARVVTGSDEPQVGASLLRAPLEAVLEWGLSDGSFPAARPDLDARTIWAITWEVISWERTGVVALSWDQARDHVLRYARAALGASD